MSRHIFSDDDTSYIIKEHFITKRPINDIAIEFGVTHKVIKRIIVQEGRKPINFKKWHYGVFVLKCAIALYDHGVGVRGISSRLNINVNMLTSEFKRQGIKLRTQSEQEKAKWSLMTTKQREYQVDACHKAR